MSRLALAALAAITVTFGGVLLLTQSTAYAATITVDSLDDTVAGDDVCTLREAIENANDDADGQPHADCDAGNPAGEDLIVFDVDGMIVLASELPQIDGDLVIDGGDDIEIDGSSSTRILTLGDAALTLQAITLRNGQTDEAGGAVLSASGGALTVIDSSFIANNAPGGGATAETGAGGAIAVLDGTLAVSGSTFTSNGAEADGGAIYAAGSVEIDDTVFDDNASAAGNGGAIWAESPDEPDQLDLTGVTFISNRSALSGGAVYTGNHTIGEGITAEDNEAEEHGGVLYIAGSDLDVVDSTFVLNAAGESGGAIYLDSGNADIQNSTFEENEAIGSGGALYTEDATVEVLATSFELNVAGVDGGAISGNESTLTAVLSEFYINEATGNGGAIAVTARVESGVELLMEDSTLGGNFATNGGGVFLGVDSGSEITGSTLTGNRASVHGGAIYNESELAVWNSTFTENEAIEEGGALLSGGLLELRNATFHENEADVGGAIRTLEDSDTDITNTVVAASVEGDNCSFEEDPTGVDESNISDDDSCGEPHFVEVEDVELGNLEMNGGPTATLLPADTSPLVDAGDSATCPDDDQRGEERPVGEGCDIGAIELQDPLTPTPTPTPEPLGDLFVPQIARDVEHN